MTGSSFWGSCFLRKKKKDKNKKGATYSSSKGGHAQAQFQSEAKIWAPSCTYSQIADVNVSGTEPQPGEAASAFQTDSEKLQK